MNTTSNTFGRAIRDSQEEVWRPEFGSGLGRLASAIAWGVAVCAPFLASTAWFSYQGVQDLRADSEVLGDKMLERTLNDELAVE